MIYNHKIIDDAIPLDIHKAAYDYCNAQRWYAGTREVPQLDFCPNVDGHEVDPIPKPAHRSIYRAPFAGVASDLQYHPPIQALFDYMNENVFEGKMVLDGLHEPSPGLYYQARHQVRSDVHLTNKVRFYDHDYPENYEDWQRTIAKEGSIAYMQGHPYESVRQVRVPHRDWKGDYREVNEEQYCTVMFVANLVWKPEWSGEFTIFNDATGDIPGAKFEDLRKNRGIGVGWPYLMVDNKPGRIFVQDGRQLHASRYPTEQAPEMTMHINFRVRFNNYFPTDKILG